MLNFLIVSLCFLGVLASASLPEENMDVPHLIAYNGYPSEQHQVVTEDGYILTVHRIPYGRDGKFDPAKPRPVFFLQHGLLASSSNWVTNLPNESLGFVLADAGFDVWMGNFRGNLYSMSHMKYSNTDAKFWEFTWDEMGMYDLPAMLSYALKRTGVENLQYLGHSEGTMTAFAHFSSKPDGVARNVSHFYALAPVAQVGHIDGLLKYLGEHTSLLAFVLNTVGVNDFLPESWLMTMFTNAVCGFFVTNPLCSNLLFLIAGPNSDQLNSTRLPVYLAHTPAGTSSRNIVHFGQGVENKEFAMYDYGSSKANMANYGSSTPPLYRPENMKVPVSLYYSDKDWLADPLDVQFLLETLRSINGTHHVSDFNHLDFIWGTRAAKELYQPIAQKAIAVNAGLRNKQ